MAAGGVVEWGGAPEDRGFFFFFSVAAQSVKGDELLLVCLCSWRCGDAELHWPLLSWLFLMLRKTSLESAEKTEHLLLICCSWYRKCVPGLRGWGWGGGRSGAALPAVVIIWRRKGVVHCCLSLLLLFLLFSEMNIIRNDDTTVFTRQFDSFFFFCFFFVFFFLNKNSYCRTFEVHSYVAVGPGGFTCVVFGLSLRVKKKNARLRWRGVLVERVVMAEGKLDLFLFCFCLQA